MISFIIPTIGRPTLQAAIDSVRPMLADEIIVVGAVPDKVEGCVRYIHCERGNDWGCRERTLGMAHARGLYLAFLDDDDVYLPDAREMMVEAIRATPGVPILFRMMYPNGYVLWRDPELRCGNVSSDMIVIPNQPAMLGQWTIRREGDFDFLASMKWNHKDIAWRTEVTALQGHNDVFA